MVSEKKIMNGMDDPGVSVLMCLCVKFYYWEGVGEHTLMNNSTTYLNQWKTSNFDTKNKKKKKVN